MAKKVYRRNLLKFSSYSIALVLPKQLLDQFSWQAGDQIRVERHPKLETLLLHKEHAKKARGTIDQKIEIVQPQPEQTAIKQSIDSLEILPIPELD